MAKVKRLFTEKILNKKKWLQKLKTEKPEFEPGTIVRVRNALHHHDSEDWFCWGAKMSSSG